MPWGTGSLSRPAALAIGLAFLACGGRTSYLQETGADGAVATPTSAPGGGPVIMPPTTEPPGHGGNSTAFGGASGAGASIGAGQGGMTSIGGMTSASGMTSGGEAGETGSGGDAGCESLSSEALDAPSCGYDPAQTMVSYRGTLWLFVEGVLENTPGSAVQDAFYNLDVDNQSTALSACPDCFRYNFASEANCVCSYECPNSSHRVADLLLDGYPAFEPSHRYTVRLAIGDGATQLRFGMADCGCSDNSGTYLIKLEPYLPSCTPPSL
ncbi:MAG TPA: hypothetical protein VGI10_30905 [Polyangiaceae bacterium]|jgi:hypothetical protein